MKYILAIAYREYRIRLSNPIFPLWDVLVPVVYLLVFGASFDRLVGPTSAGVDYPTFFLGGVLGMVTFSIALNSSYAFFEDLQSGMFHELLTYPFARRDLLLGKLVFNAGFSVVCALLCVIAAVAVLGIEVRVAAVPGLVLWVVVGTASWYFLCSAIALGVRSFNGYHTATSALYLLLMFVSSLFYPTDLLPDGIRWLALANPLSWQVDLLRYHSYGAGEAFVLQLEAVGCVAFAFSTFWLANRNLNAPIE